MNNYLDVRNSRCASAEEERKLSQTLDAILSTDASNGTFAMLGAWQRIVGDNRKREQWDAVFEKMRSLFLCGRSVPLDGPMIGVSLGIRDSDYFRRTAGLFGKERSAIANLEWMATCWNMTFGTTGLWMGKTFEPVTREVFASKCAGCAAMLERYNPATTRIGRNFFRDPANPNPLQGLGVPALTKLWSLRDRPWDASAPGFEGQLLAANLEKEKAIPYRKTGGLFLALPASSVVPEMNGKEVYHLNYRWAAFDAAYPMTRLIDELVQIDDGVYLGQLVMATEHYGLGTVHFSLFGEHEWHMGEQYEAADPFAPGKYGYQNNGFFLMIDPARARDAYSDEAFPFLRPRPGETGYTELGYDRATSVPAAGSSAPGDWARDPELRAKFTTLTLEDSPKGASDGDIREELRDGETALQMLQRIQGEISKATRFDDHVRHFEKLNRLFRRGIAPTIANGLYRGRGRGFNTSFDAPERIEWYGQEEPCRGFDYYHGATLNLHFGMADTWRPALERRFDEGTLYPPALADWLRRDPRGPNLLNSVWATIGRLIFPWAGKSFEKISGRKLSMLLDESPDLAERYPERVHELESHLASWPHYDLVKKNRDGYWKQDGPYAAHLKGGSWDRGMSPADREFWEQEAASRWVFGYNLEDSRILIADAAMRLLDMNHRAPVPSIQALADAGPSPFVRQGYMFLGTCGRESILPMNSGAGAKKQVFQFHYRYPMIGGPVPIGFCLDEIVEIAEGLILGQLIYSTDFSVPFHSSTPTDEFKYQLFGYFLLLDNTWEKHRRAIGFDVNT
jgi:hypothetical protein